MGGWERDGDTHTHARTHGRKKGSSDVLAAGDDGGGATRADGVPVEGTHGAEAKDAVEHADHNHHERNKETKDVRHAKAEHADKDVDETLHEAVVEERELGRDGRHVQLAQNHRDPKNAGLFGMRKRTKNKAHTRDRCEKEMDENEKWARWTNTASAARTKKVQR